MDMNYDFGGWATRANMLCSDGRTIMRDAFIEDDGCSVPLVWNHQHNEPANVLGHALLENRDQGVYAYCTFNETEAGKMGRELVKNRDVTHLSIYANKLKQRDNNVLHGAIREVSLVIAGANPGARIDTVLCHNDDSDEEAVIYTDEDIELVHSAEEASIEDVVIEHADNDSKEDKPNMAETKERVEETKTEEVKQENKEKTVKDVFDTFTDEQKEVVYALIGQALEDAANGEDDDEVEHSEGGNEIMYTNIFDRDEVKDATVLSHADQEEIIKMAKMPGQTFKTALNTFIADHKDTLAHGFDTTGDDAISQLFPDFKDVYPGAPELLERDQSWVAQVMNKAHKSPVPRVRTRQVDARAAALRAKGYNNRESEKSVAGNVKILSRTTEPQTIYYRDSLHRDDVIDITDFDVVAYQKNIMTHGLKEVIALAALVGDGRADTDPDKINTDNIRPIWNDNPLYTIQGLVDVAAAEEKLQGTGTGTSFGEEFIFAEAFITAALYARETYKGKGDLDFYCAPHTLNKMLLARDMNGRRIYDSAADLAKVLNVKNIFTVEQFEGLKREDDDGNEYTLHGIFVNMAHYQFGCAKGGEITSFEQFDIDFNNYKYLMETRLSGALVDPYSAIAMEELTTASVSA